jgi:asparagine synthase (glutamine-hydrolysing)
MCGICGSTNDPSGSQVARMNAAMLLRGPDDDGTFSDAAAGVSLGARRLSIIDIEGGHQPVTNEDGTICAILNGEVYNHRALRETLSGHGHRFASGVDTEVLVHLYEDYGAAMVHSLEGMYAFALWDARREVLLLARDRFGEKPLFYVEGGGDLQFASELDALIAGINRTPELDPEAVDAFFVFGYVPGPDSMVRGVKQLPPGHLLRWERRARRVSIEPYWTPVVSAAPTGFEAPFEELVAETGRLLERSVRSRLIADVPLGVFLSGGLDSTLIAAIAARSSSTPVKTFTVGYDTGGVSETAQARRTAQEIGTEHHELLLPQEELIGRVPAVLAGMDQPLADQALVSLHAIAEHARRDVTVAIGGEGADELFGGYPRYRWLWRSERLGRALPASLASALSILAACAPHSRAARVGDVLRPGRAVERHLDWVTARRRVLRERLYGPALHGIRHHEIVGDLDARLNGGSSNHVIRKLMELDQQHWLPDDVLVKADRAGMRVSLEIRTPYLNRELVEFAGTVSERVHVAHGGKALLRALLAQVAPRAARRRRKTAFRVPIAQWLRGPLAPVVDRQLATGSVFDEGWFDRAEAGALIAEHRAGIRDRSAAIWPLLAFGLWLDRMRGLEAS